MITPSVRKKEDSTKKDSWYINEITQIFLETQRPLHRRLMK